MKQIPGIGDREIDQAEVGANPSLLLVPSQIELDSDLPANLQSIQNAGLYGAKNWRDGECLEQAHRRKDLKGKAVHFRALPDMSILV